MQRPEERARRVIDAALEAAGWVVQDPRAYLPTTWRLCLLSSLDGSPVSRDEALSRG